MPRKMIPGTIPALQTIHGLQMPDSDRSTDNARRIRFFIRGIRQASSLLRHEHDNRARRHMNTSLVVKLRQGLQILTVLIVDGRIHAHLPLQSV